MSIGRQNSKRGLALAVLNVPLILLSCAAVWVNIALGPDVALPWDACVCACGETASSQFTTLQAATLYAALSFMSGLPTIVLSTLLAGAGLRRTESTAVLERMLAGAGFRLAECAIVPRTTSVKRFLFATLPLAGIFIGLAMLGSFLLFVLL